LIRRIAILLALTPLTGMASAGGIVIDRPPKGSAARAAVLDALRPAVEARLGRGIVFVPDVLRTGGGWAFVRAEPRRASGAAIDPARAFPDDWEAMDGVTVTAVLTWRKGRWNLVEHAIGATDVWYCDLYPRAVRVVAQC